MTGSSRLGVLASGGILLGLSCVGIAGLVGTGPEPLGVWARGTLPVLAMVVVVTAVSFVLGVATGALSALGPPLADTILAGLMEIVGAMPLLVVVVVVRALHPVTGFLETALSLGVVRGLTCGKGVRAELLQLEGEPYVQATRALGAGPLRLFTRHLYRHVSGSAFADASTSAALVVALDAALAFLGLGTPDSGWGSLLAESARASRPSLSILPTAGVLATLAASWLLSSALSREDRLPRWL